MQSISLIDLAGLTIAAALPQRDVQLGLAITGPPTAVLNRTYTAGEAHQSIMGAFPSERVVTSDALHKYFRENLGSNHAIYVSDQREFIHMSSLVAKPTPKREDGLHNIECQIKSMLRIHQALGCPNIIMAVSLECHLELQLHTQVGPRRLLLTPMVVFSIHHRKRRRIMRNHRRSPVHIS